MTIEEALSQIRVVVPPMDRSVFIKAEVKDFNHFALGHTDRLHVNFQIWDERDHYEGPTLEIAVQKCLLANTPDQSKIEEVEAFAVEAGK